MPAWLPYAITWLLSTVVTAAAIYGAMRAKLANVHDAAASLTAKLDMHIEKNSKVHERIASLESSVLSMSDRMKGVADMSHRFNTAHNEEERHIREWAAGEFIRITERLTR